MIIHLAGLVLQHNTLKPEKVFMESVGAFFA